MTIDVFRPAKDPYRAIYDAFRAAADRRPQCNLDAAIHAEVDAVHRAAVSQAAPHQLRAPTRHEVEMARQGAMGHTDFGLTWACAVVRAMQRPRPSLPAPAAASPLYREGWVRGDLHAASGGDLDADGPTRAQEEVWVGFIDALAAHKQLELAHA